MAKKDLCAALWDQIVQDTKVFANQVFGKLLNKSSASSRACGSVYEYHPQHFTPHNSISYTSTVSLVNITTASHTSLESTHSGTRHYNAIQDMAFLQYETLWEVQLALGEIPGMIEAGNILQPCQPIQSQQNPCSFASRLILSQPIEYQYRPQYRPHEYLPAETYEHYSFPAFAPSSISSTVSTASSAVGSQQPFAYLANNEDEDFIWPASAQAASYTSHDISFNTNKASLSSAPSIFTNMSETQMEIASPIAISALPSSRSSLLSLSRRHSVEFTAANTTAFDTVTITSPDLPTTPSKMNDLRHDRKDSGVFIHDDEEGIIVQVSPKSKPSKSKAKGKHDYFSSNFDTDSEDDHENYDGEEQDKFEYGNMTTESRFLELRSRVMGDDLLQMDVGALALSLPSLMATVSTLSLQA